MKLLFDLGNTRLKLGWLQGGGRREPHPQALLPDALAQSLPEWLAQLPARPTAALGSAVGHATVRERIDTLLYQHAGLRVVWQQALPHALGLRNGYREPQRLGVDRWLALLGLQAHARHAASRQAQVVRLLATFGTATTIDTLLPDGRFVGGLIVPGVALMQRALQQGTAQLPSTEGGWMDYPSHTHAAIYTGVAAAQLGALQRQVNLVQRDFPGPSPHLILSGGALPELRQPLHDWQRDNPEIVLEMVDNPVLDGLSVLAARSFP